MENIISRTNILNSLFERYNFKSYLEIGVRVPSENFDLINSNIKHSVDPNPKGSCTFIMTSDVFFNNYVTQKYDVIFVDGLHTSEQSYKDVHNSINVLNDDGFIVMHDCNPPTKYHTRTYDEYLNGGGQWNGDVYKAFLLLKKELSDWSCFVIDEDFGCGILTKRKILKNINENDNVYNIIWEEFELKRNKLLQLITFDEYLKLLV